jgi:alkylhydroperoxidase family enzyme
MAHTAESAAKLGIDRHRLDAVWNYRTSSQFSEAERAALDIAVAAGCVPNAVTDEMFDELHRHWSGDQIVEIIGVIAMFGFLNRWNDTLATSLEDEPLDYAEAHLAPHGWEPGHHRR